MSLQVEKMEKNMAKLTIEVAAEDLEKAIHRGLDRLMVDIRLRNSPFDHFEISKLYDRYLTFIEEDKKRREITV